MAEASFQSLITLSELNQLAEFYMLLDNSMSCKYLNKTRLLTYKNESGRGGRRGREIY